MICFKDTTYCASPNCTNECGRKMSDQEIEQLKRLDLYVAYAYFCGEPDGFDSDETKEK